MSSLLEDLLRKPVSPIQKRQDSVPEYTSRVEFTGSEANIELNGDKVIDESAARELLRQRGEDPDQWVATKFESSERELASGQVLVSNKYAFARVGTKAALLAQHALQSETETVGQIIQRVQGWEPVEKSKPADGKAAFIIAMGDMQYGKIDGDGPEGTIKRVYSFLDRARETLDWYQQRYDIGQLHIAWLGDHVEGFVSQGGANTWRTPLTLTDQIMLTQESMLKAIETFGDQGLPLSMAAVPGNHGEAVRFHGKGVTRYDDSHDTGALISIQKTVRQFAPWRLGPHDLEFFVPDTDELTVVLPLGGTNVAHSHGHAWKPGKHFDWWTGQAFGGSPLADCELLLAGHLHHEFMESSGRRLFAQVPAFEYESTWYRHNTGVPGAPGGMVMVTQNGLTSPIEVIRG